MATTPDTGHDGDQSSESTPREPGDGESRVADLEREVARLEREVAERDRELRRVVQRYEALLDEQTRARRAEGGSDDDRFVWSGRRATSSSGSILSTMRQVLAGGW